MKNQIPKQGEFYRHFKNKYYQIINVAIHSETKEKLVIYQALYGDFLVYARPLEMFISEVDHEKYPDVKQTFRFEKVDADSIGEVFGNRVEEMTKIDVKAWPVKDSKKETDRFVDKIFHKKGSEEALEKVEKIREELKEGDHPNPILMEFLDIRTMDGKVKFLAENKRKLTDELINAMAASIDVTVDDGPIELRYSSLRTCLQTKAKYEITRLRNK